MKHKSAAKKEMGTESKRQMNSGKNNLMAACEQGRTLDVKIILQKKPLLITSKDRNGKMALHYCAESGSVPCAQQIIAADSTLINAQDNEGFTPLHLAVIAGHRAMVKFLLKYGADLNSVDKERHSCVHWAAVCGDVETLDVLLTNGADPSTSDILGAYPIHYAAQMCGPHSLMGNDERVGLNILRKLLRRGASVQCRDRDGRESLLWAASAGSSEAILLLFSSGASVMAADKDGLTALHCAASRGNTSCVETLVTLCGARINGGDSLGCSALFYAAAQGHADCTHTLLNYGADPNIQDSKGRTPAHCAATKGQWETMRILDSNGADLWMRNSRGNLPIHEAVQSGRKDLVQWLLQQRPQAVNASNISGRTSLHIACQCNNVEMCEVLIEYGAFINPLMVNAKGFFLTPLDVAVYQGNQRCAKFINLHGGIPASKVLENSEIDRSLLFSLGNRACNQKEKSDDDGLSMSSFEHLPRGARTVTIPTMPKPEVLSQPVQTDDVSTAESHLTHLVTEDPTDASVHIHLTTDDLWCLWESLMKGFASEDLSESSPRSKHDMPAKPQVDEDEQPVIANVYLKKVNQKCEEVVNGVPVEKSIELNRKSGASNEDKEEENVAQYIVSRIVSSRENDMMASMQHTRDDIREIDDRCTCSSHASGMDSEDTRRKERIIRDASKEVKYQSQSVGSDSEVEEDKSASKSTRLWKKKSDLRLWGKQIDESETSSGHKPKERQRYPYMKKLHQRKHARKLEIQSLSLLEQSTKQLLEDQQQHGRSIDESIKNPMSRQSVDESRKISSRENKPTPQSRQSQRAKFIKPHFNNSLDHYQDVIIESSDDNDDIVTHRNYSVKETPTAPLTNEAQSEQHRGRSRRDSKPHLQVPRQDLGRSTQPSSDVSVVDTDIMVRDLPQKPKSQPVGYHHYHHHHHHHHHHHEYETLNKDIVPLPYTSRSEETETVVTTHQLNKSPRHVGRDVRIIKRPAVGTRKKKHVSDDDVEHALKEPASLGGNRRMSEVLPQRSDTLDEWRDTNVIQPHNKIEEEVKPLEIMEHQQQIHEETEKCKSKSVKHKEIKNHTITIVSDHSDNEVKLNTRVKVGDNVVVETKVRISDENQQVVVEETRQYDDGKRDLKDSTKLKSDEKNDPCTIEEPQEPSDEVGSNKKPSDTKPGSSGPMIIVEECVRPNEGDENSDSTDRSSLDKSADTPQQYKKDGKPASHDIITKVSEINDNKLEDTLSNEGEQFIPREKEMKRRASIRKNSVNISDTKVPNEKPTSAKVREIPTSAKVRDKPTSAKEEVLIAAKDDTDPTSTKYEENSSSVEGETSHTSTTIKKKLAETATDESDKETDKRMNDNQETDENCKSDQIVEGHQIKEEIAINKTIEVSGDEEEHIENKSESPITRGEETIERGNSVKYEDGECSIETDSTQRISEKQEKDEEDPEAIKYEKQKLTEKEEVGTDKETSKCVPEKTFETEEECEQELKHKKVPDSENQTSDSKDIKQEPDEEPSGKQTLSVPLEEHFVSTSKQIEQDRNAVYYETDVEDMQKKSKPKETSQHPRRPSLAVEYDDRLMRERTFISKSSKSKINELNENSQTSSLKLSNASHEQMDSADRNATKLESKTKSPERVRSDSSGKTNKKGILTKCVIPSRAQTAEKDKHEQTTKDKLLDTNTTKAIPEIISSDKKKSRTLKAPKVRKYRHVGTQVSEKQKLESKKASYRVHHHKQQELPKPTTKRNCRNRETFVEFGLKTSKRELKLKKRLSCTEDVGVQTKRSITIAVDPYKITHKLETNKKEVGTQIDDTEDIRDIATIQEKYGEIAITERDDDDDNSDEDDHNNDDLEPDKSNAHEVSQRNLGAIFFLDDDDEAETVKKPFDGENMEFRRLNERGELTVFCNTLNDRSQQKISEPKKTRQTHSNLEKPGFLWVHFGSSSSPIHSTKQKPKLTSEKRICKVKVSPIKRIPEKSKMIHKPRESKKIPTTTEIKPGTRPVRYSRNVPTICEVKKCEKSKFPVRDRSTSKEPISRRKSVDKVSTSKTTLVPVTRGMDNETFSKSQSKLGEDEDSLAKTDKRLINLPSSQESLDNGIDNVHTTKENVITHTTSTTNGGNVAKEDHGHGGKDSTQQDGQMEAGKPQDNETTREKHELSRDDSKASSEGNKSSSPEEGQMKLVIKRKSDPDFSIRINVPDSKKDIKKPLEQGQTDSDRSSLNNSSGYVSTVESFYNNRRNFRIDFGNTTAKIDAKLPKQDTADMSSGIVDPTSDDLDSSTSTGRKRKPGHKSEDSANLTSHHIQEATPWTETIPELSLSADSMEEHIASPAIRGNVPDELPKMRQSSDSYIQQRASPSGIESLPYIKSSHTGIKVTDNDGQNLQFPNLSERIDEKDDLLTPRSKALKSLKFQEKDSTSAKRSPRTGSGIPIARTYSETSLRSPSKHRLTVEHNVQSRSMPSLREEEVSELQQRSQMSSQRKSKTLRRLDTMGKKSQMPITKSNYHALYRPITADSPNGQDLRSKLPLLQTPVRCKCVIHPQRDLDTRRTRSAIDFMANIDFLTEQEMVRLGQQAIQRRRGRLSHTCDTFKERCTHPFKYKALRTQTLKRLKKGRRAIREGKDSITFHVDHNRERNSFKLPTDKLEDNKKWQVVFTIAKTEQGERIITKAN